MEKLMSERIDTNGRMKKKFKEQDRHSVGLGCDNIEMDRMVRNVMSDLSGLKKLVKGLSDRFDEYEGSKVFKDKRVLEEELFKDSFPLPLGSQVREPPAEPSARPVPPPYLDNPYVVTRDAAIVAATIATFVINDDDDDDTASIDSQPYEPHGSPFDTQTMPPRKSTKGNPPPLLIQDTERAVGLIRWIEKTEMVFTVSKCIEANKVVFVAATFQDRSLTWWNSQVATLGIEAVTRKTWAEMKVMMTEEFCPPKEIQRMELILCPVMVPTERKKVEAYIRGLSENIKGEVTSSEQATLNKAVRMAYTLMEQKVKVITEREADNKKMKWENF
nr:hypothetical protein [Tanacetum cinerariifolium]